MPRTRTISQHHITPDDVPILLKWRNSNSFLSLCTKRETTLTENQFREELRDDFRFDRCEQVLIVVDGEPAGTAFSYRYSAAGRHVFVSIFLEEQYRGHAIGVYALANFVAGIFRRIDLHKIYLETYSFNTTVVRLLTRLGFSLEGEFKEHCMHRRGRHDLLTFAAYRETMALILDRFRNQFPRHAGLSELCSFSLGHAATSEPISPDGIDREQRRAQAFTPN
jgi:RimJ/RimL family protein N-acetyltransferase